MTACNIWSRALLGAAVLGTHFSSAVAQSPPPAAKSEDDSRGYLAGNGLLNRGLFELAADEYTRFLSDGPDHEKAPLARYGLAVCHFRLKKFDAALSELQKLAKPPKAFPYAVEVAVMTGQCLLAEKKHDEAAKALGAVVRDAGDHELADDAAALLVEALIAAGKDAEAAERAEEFAKRYPESALLTQVQRSRRSADLAVAHAAFEAQEYERAQTVFDRVAASRSASGHSEANKTAESIAAEAAYWAAKCRLRRGEAAEAATRLEAAIARHPDCELAAEMRYDLSVSLIRAGRADAAIVALSEFCEKHGKHALLADALHLLAVCEHQRRGYDASQAVCTRFMAQFSKHELAAKVAWLAAENDLLAGRIEEAARRYEKFERMYPGDPLAKVAPLRAGLALYRVEKFDEAARKLADVVVGDQPSEESRPAWLAMGDIAYQRGEWADAERLLRGYLGDGKGEVAAADDAWLKLGLSLLRLEKPEAALPCFDAILARHGTGPHALQARFERGQALLALRKFDEARAEFEKVLAEGGKESRFASFANQHLAAIALQQRDFGSAAERYRLVADSSSGAAVGDALLRRGEALLAAEQFGEAEKSLREYLAGGGRSEKSALARARLVIAVSRQDRHADALKEIAALDRDGVAKLDATLRRSIRQEQAWCLRKLNKTTEAAELYRRLLADAGDAGDPSAALELAELEAAGERYEAAAELLRPLASGPAELRPAVLYRLGVCEFKLNRFKESLAALEELLKSNEAEKLRASAAYFAGESAFQLQQFEKAVDHFSRVVESHKDDPACGPSMLRMAESLAAMQRWPRSEKVFSDFLDRFPSSEQWHQARFGVGWARENQQRYDEAIEAYRDVTARHKGPTAARAQFQIGECLFARKQYEEAVRELLKVDILYAYPEWSAAALYEAGRCFEALNKRVEARAQYAAVVEKHGKSKWADPASKRLAELKDGGVPGK